MAKGSKLTARQAKFAAAYDGNATEAARKAGYAGDDATLATQGYRLLRKAEVREAIGARTEGELEGLTLTVDELQQEWTRLAIDPKQPAEVRLAAMRDLAKSQGAFVHRHEHAIGKSLEELLREAMEGPAK